MDVSVEQQQIGPNGLPGRWVFRTDRPEGDQHKRGSHRTACPPARPVKGLIGRLMTVSWPWKIHEYPSLPVLVANAGGVGEGSAKQFIKGAQIYAPAAGRFAAYCEGRAADLLKLAAEFRAIEATAQDKAAAARAMLGARTVKRNREAQKEPNAGGGERLAVSPVEAIPVAEAAAEVVPEGRPRLGKPSR